MNHKNHQKEGKDKEKRKETTMPGTHQVGGKTIFL